MENDDGLLGEIRSDLLCVFEEELFEGQRRLDVDGTLDVPTFKLHVKSGVDDYYSLLTLLPKQIGQRVARDLVLVISKHLILSHHVDAQSFVRGLQLVAGNAETLEHLRTLRAFLISSDKLVVILHLEVALRLRRLAQTPSIRAHSLERAGTEALSVVGFFALDLGPLFSCAYAKQIHASVPDRGVLLHHGVEAGLGFHPAAAASVFGVILVLVGVLGYQVGHQHVVGLALLFVLRVGDGVLVV